MRRRGAIGALLVWRARGLAAAIAQEAPIPLSDEVAGSTEQLQSLRREIKAVREEMADLDSRRQDADRSLGQVTREMGLVKELLAGLDQREVILALQRDSLEVRLVAQNETYDLRKQALAERLRALSMQGPQRDIEQILTSESFSTLVARFKFGAMLARVDGNLMDRTRRQGARIEAEQGQLQAALAGIWEAREEARGERERLELLEAERLGLRRELAAEQDRTAGELARLERQEQQLADLLARLEARREKEVAAGATPRSSGPGFLDRRGSLPWPASGSVVREFGRNVHPRFGTVTMHNGLSIATVAGAPVYAVSPARVEFADHLPGFGRCVILDHGAGHYTLYANLARIFVSRGTSVDDGQILAEMGDDQPRLYFEIREGREAQDPRTWLRPPR